VEHPHTVDLQAIMGHSLLVVLSTVGLDQEDQVVLQGLGSVLVAHSNLE